MSGGVEWFKLKNLPREGYGYFLEQHNILSFITVLLMTLVGPSCKKFEISLHNLGDTSCSLHPLTQHHSIWLWKKILKVKGYLKGCKNCLKWHVHQNGRTFLYNENFRIVFSPLERYCLCQNVCYTVGETRTNPEGHMVLWCNGLALKNHFKMFFSWFQEV